MESHSTKHCLIQSGSMLKHLPSPLLSYLEHSLNQKVTVSALGGRKILDLIGPGGQVHKTACDTLFFIGGQNDLSEEYGSSDTSEYGKRLAVRLTIALCLLSKTYPNY